MERRADRARPDPQLTAHDLYPSDVGDVHPALDLLAHGLEQQLPGAGDPAADHDPLHPDEHHDVARADPQVPAGLLEPPPRAKIARERRRGRLLHAGLSAGGGDGVGSSKNLEAALIAAAASRPIGNDRLVAELSGGAFVAQVKMPTEDQASANPRAERDAQHRGRPATRAHAVLRQRKGTRVVDQADLRPNLSRHLVCHLHTVPISGDVGNEPGHARVGVEDTRHPDTDRFDALDGAGDNPRHIEKLPDDALFASMRVGRQAA